MPQPRGAGTALLPARRDGGFFPTEPFSARTSRPPKRARSGDPLPQLLLHGARAGWGRRCEVGWEGGGEGEWVWATGLALPF